MEGSGSPRQQNDDEDERKMPASSTNAAESNGHGLGTAVDDDEDDWSRLVETDEATQGNLNEESFRMESVVEQMDEEEEEKEGVPLPSQPELTMKERLVLRERQRRIETERARLKRQFALSNGNEEDLSEEAPAAAALENGSAAGTLGEESTMVHPDEESTNQERLGFNMERFLRNSDSFNPQLEPTDELNPVTTEQGVVMERFLNDPVVIESNNGGRAEPDASTSSPESGVQRTVSFEAEIARTVTATTAEGAPDSTAVMCDSLPSFGADTDVSMDANASMQVQADEEDVTREELLQTPMPESSDGDADGPAVVRGELRVLRLTEADMQEMAATEEASIANAPPSEREGDILSEVGELADFSGLGTMHRGGGGTFSLDTPTTAMESASLPSVGGHGSEKPASSAVSSSERHSLMEGDGASAAANPPSETGEDDVDPLHVDESAVARSQGQDEEGDRGDHGRSSVATAVVDNTYHSQEEPIINRRIRPGMVSFKPPPSGPTATNYPDAGIVVDDFDYDKDQVESPYPDNLNSDSFHNLPDDDDTDGRAWSPENKMQVSPIHVPMGADRRVIGANPNYDSSYGAVEEGASGLRRIQPPMLDDEDAHNKKSTSQSEATPLLRNVPPEIITTVDDEDETSPQRNVGRGLARVLGSKPRRSPPRSVRDRPRMDSLFSDLRSEEDSSKAEMLNEAEKYDASGAFERAIPERFFALTVTLIFEIPVLLMISGGSDALCALVGRWRYQLLMGFIPLTSAISGNVGLQASTLTTRAISHNHVTTRDFRKWFLEEVGAACYLGIGMGLLLGSIAFFASQMDAAFGLTIMIAQCISIVTAGCTGTFAPLMFSFIFKRDSGKWGGPLETAIQDIVGSFAMVVLSYQILKFLGPGPIDPSDVCGGAVDDDT